MMRRCVVLFLAVVVFTSVSFAGENPMYQNWNQFKPGSFVTFKTTVKTAGVTTEMEITYSLKQVTPEKLTMELKTSTTTMGYTVNAPAQTIEIPAEGGPAGMSIPGVPMNIPQVNVTGTTVSEGSSEKIVIKGKSIDAQKTTVKTAQANVSIWISSEIPGGMVKALTETAAATVKMVASDYKAIK